jgi:hypothetical protein
LRTPELALVTPCADSPKCGSNMPPLESSTEVNIRVRVSEKVLCVDELCLLSAWIFQFSTSLMYSVAPALQSDNHCAAIEREREVFCFSLNIYLTLEHL